MKKILPLLFLLPPAAFFAQVQIAFQGFESGDSWTISAGAGNISSATGSGDTPANQRIRTGSNSWQVINGSATLDLADFSISGYTNVKVRVRLSSTSGTTGNGADGTDNVRIFVALNGGSFPGTADITISGNSNARWGYTANLVVSTTAGTPVSVSAQQGGTNDNNYATADITIPSGNNSVALRVTALNNDPQERWNIDDIELLGDVSCTPPATQATNFSASDITTTSMTVNWTRGDGDNVLVVARQGGAVNADPVQGVSYTANAAFGSGQQIGTGNYVVYSGPGTSETVTGLSVNTTYHFAIYEYASSGPCYNLTELTGNATTNPTVSFSASTSSVTEGNSGTTNLNVQVSILASPSADVAVEITDALTGSATAGVDYSFTSPTTLTFIPGGATTQNAVIAVTGDTDFENNETVVLTLNVTSGPAANGATTTHTATITNDDSGTFYSTGDGDFFDANFWASTPGGTGAFTYPGVGNTAFFIILSGHTVTINSNNVSVTAAGITVEGALQLNDENSGITINNGAAGADFTVNGTFLDNGNGGGGNGVSFGSGATWKLGASATLIKTNDSDTQGYRDRYDGGMNTIPSTANWILRYTTAGNDPNIVSVGGTYYPNLIIESINGNWNPATGASRFQGASDYPRVKGDLDIGGSGTGTVTFYNQNTNATPVTVLGSLIVRSGSTFTNNGSSAGTGVRVEGDVTVDGTFNWNAGTGGAGVLELNGSVDQTISGAGTINLRNLTVNKSGGMGILNRNLTVNNLLTLSNGLLQLNTYDLTIAPSGLNIAGGSTASYVFTNNTGVLIQTLNGGISKVFPVGNSTYNPATLLNSSGGDVYNVRVFDAVLLDGESGPEFTSSVVDRTWMIDSDDPGTENMTLTLQWNTAHELAGFTRTACYVSHYINGGWSGSTPGTAAGFNPWTRSRSGITSLSPFALASSGQLPVELLAFRGERIDKQALLSWETATERDNAFFAVERAGEGGAFAEIGRVGGAGTTTAPQDYTFLDPRPRPGVNLYRLRQVDFNGEYAYSHVVALRFDAAASGGARVYPSPAVSELTLEFSELSPEEIRWAVFDAAGRRVLEGALAPETEKTTLDVDELPAGLYCLQLNRGAAVEILKFVKQR